MDVHPAIFKRLINYLLIPMVTPFYFYAKCKPTSRQKTSRNLDNKQLKLLNCRNSARTLRIISKHVRPRPNSIASAIEKQKVGIMLKGPLSCYLSRLTLSADYTHPFVYEVRGILTPYYWSNLNTNYCLQVIYEWDQTVASADDPFNKEQLLFFLLCTF